VPSIKFYLFYEILRLIPESFMSFPFLVFI
jgi:hypothetical protein